MFSIVRAHLTERRFPYRFYLASPPLPLFDVKRRGYSNSAPAPDFSRTGEHEGWRGKRERKLACASLCVVCSYMTVLTNQRAFTVGSHSAQWARIPAPDDQWE